MNPFSQSQAFPGHLWPRRRFLRTALAAGTAAVFRGSADPTPEGGWKAAVIGSTGHGDFGHGLEAIFRDVPGIAEVTLADPDPAGRRRAAATSGAIRTHADWKELLRVERPHLVSLASRHAEEHASIALACIGAGAHLYVEKPFVRDPAEADAVLQAADRRGRRVAVAHTMRMSPAAQAVLAALRSGRIGELREIHAWGKQDHRSGGEDLMVLGSHLFDFFRLYAGDPLWVTARMLQKGRDIVASDRRRVADDVGWVAGDRVSAQFAFAEGVTGTFTSDPSLRETTAKWGVELLGSRGSARLNCDLAPSAFLRASEPWGPSGRQDRWVPLEGVAPISPSDHNRLPVADWLASIRESREPACSGRNGAWAVEMVAGVYQAALGGSRVRFPLAERRHPLDP